MEEERRGFRLLVFLAAFCCLMFELIISRVADFHLDARNSFIAIPITFLGLALGSLHVHFRRRIVERFSIRANLILLAVVSFSTLAVVFFIFSQYMTVIGAFSFMSAIRHTLNKTLFFVAAFIVPFYCFGRILTVCYHLNRERIGAIYSADFLGASLGCFLTPVLFHVLSLPGVLFAFTCGLSVLILIFLRLPWKAAAGLFVLLALVTGGLLAFLTYADNHTNFNDLFSGESGAPSEEVAHAWNEFSRVSVLRVRFPGRNPSYTIMHDNAQSNVNISRYRPGVFRHATRPLGIEALFLRGKPVQDIMVMFAGCGAEMVPLYELSGGQAHITGIELNPLVKQLAEDTPELADFRLKEFYALPNIDLKIMEGRSFLISDPNKYDVVFVGSKAQTAVKLTGHSRKYLDTVEAYGLYLDHLREGGVLFFDHQPLDDVITTLKRVFEERKLPPFEQSAIALKVGRRFDLMVAPGGFSREDAAALVKADDPKNALIDYAPFVKESGGRLASTIRAPLDPKVAAITDDRPFVWKLAFEDYTPFPSLSRFANEFFYFNWTRITTLLGLSCFASFFIVIACIGKTRRLPAATLIYLLITGFCYMLVEVTFMAKLELFLQNLFVSMATTLTVILIASAAGSALSERFAKRLDMRIFAFAVALLVWLSMFVLDYLTHHLLGLPLAARILVVVLAVFPVGMCLGVFYPFAIAGLVARGCENAVPITYGVSTLASVVGATYAMTMMLNWGFNRLLEQVALAYVVLGIFVAAYCAVSKRNVLALK